MALRIQVFVLLCCTVTTSMAGISAWKKAFSQLENKVKVQQEEIKSLHQIIEEFNKRLELLEAKGEFHKVKYNLQSLLFMPVSHDNPPIDYRVYGLIYDINLYQLMARRA